MAFITARFAMTSRISRGLSETLWCLSVGSGVLADLVRCRGGTGSRARANETWNSSEDGSVGNTWTISNGASPSLTAVSKMSTNDSGVKVEQWRSMNSR